MECALDADDVPAQIARGAVPATIAAFAITALEGGFFLALDVDTNSALFNLEIRLGDSLFFEHVRLAHARNRLPV